MAKDNSYLTSFKIDLVRQVMEGHELKAVAQKYGVSKSPSGSRFQRSCFLKSFKRRAMTFIFAFKRSTIRNQLGIRILIGKPFEK